MHSHRDEITRKVRAFIEAVSTGQTSTQIGVLAFDAVVGTNKSHGGVLHQDQAVANMARNMARSLAVFPSGTGWR